MDKYSKVLTVPLRGLVFFPRIEVSFDVGRPASVKAAKQAINNNQILFLLPQRSHTVEIVGQEDDLCDVGVLATITQLVSVDSKKDVWTAVVSPFARARKIEMFSTSAGTFVCDVEIIEDEHGSIVEEMAHMHLLEATFADFIENSDIEFNYVPEELSFPEDLSYYTDFVALNLFHSPSVKQSVLEETDVCARADQVIIKIKELLRSIEIEKSIDSEVQATVDKNQDEFLLREKLNAIRSRLGEGGIPGDDEFTEYRDKIMVLPLDQETKDKLIKEASKLPMMQPGSMDAGVIRNYLDEVLAVPWNDYSVDCTDISKARAKLEADHYGLDKIKERFVELVTANKYDADPGAQIICLVGPPGVGKTSIVASIAEAMHRKYVRLSLGGVHDEAEIRGHRKTYVGAMPGRIISALKQAKTMNPVILLDEIDKTVSDGHGDPASALLEVLDPAQNKAFRDNFIGIPVDLSKVLFITTANDPDTIPAPLYDRMEIIEVPGYTFEEKLNIAKKHLIKKQRKLYKLTAKQFRLPDKSLKYLITFYTREAGVRRLEQLIASLCRKVLVELDAGETDHVNITVDKLVEYLGPEKFKDDEAMKDDTVGVVNGLAWTAAGGEMLQVEAITMPGTGKLELTGNLGDVMQESAKAAYSFIRANAENYGIPVESFSNKDIHIHVPQGAVPKDGPSAGVTISTALLSALTNRSFRHDVAMTGEISLTGRVMPIGGLREKSMAAYKNGIKTVIIPEDNLSDLAEVHKTVLDNVKFIPAKNLKDVFSLSLNL